MLKLAGILCIIIGCTGMGFAYKRQFEERLWHLRRMKQVFALMSGSIRYGKATLPESCLQAAQKSEEPYRTALQEIYRMMKENKGLPFSLVWKREMEKTVRTLPVSGKEKELFLNFGTGGYMDNRMQQQSIAQYTEELEQYIRETEKQIREKSKVAVCLGIMGGMFLTIVFI